MPPPPTRTSAVPRTKRTQFSMDAALHARLKDALLRRAARAIKAGNPRRPFTLSGWITEKAREFIKSQS